MYTKSQPLIEIQTKNRCRQPQHLSSMCFCRKLLHVFPSWHVLTGIHECGNGWSVLW